MDNILIIGLTLTFLIGPFLSSSPQVYQLENLAFPQRGYRSNGIAVFEVESFREVCPLHVPCCVGTLSALVLGVPAAYALSRYRLPFAETVKTIVAAQSLFRGSLLGLDC